MKICMASDSYWPRVNGATVSIDTFRAALGRLGHSVHLLVPEYTGGAGVGPVDDENITRLPSNVLIFSSEDRLIKKGSGFRMAFELLDKIKPDVLHAQTEFSTFILFKRYGKKRNIPLVMTSHTHWEQYINNYVSWLPGLIGKVFAGWFMAQRFNKANLIITPSYQMKRVLESYKITPPIRVIPTGIDPTLFQGASRDLEKNPIIQAHNNLKGSRVILFVGRLSQEKNPDFLLDLMHGLLPEVPNLKLVIVGDGPYRNSFQEKIGRRGLESKIHFSGYVHQQDMKHYYSLAEVFVFPSKTETQGLVTIESMLCGTPVVAIGAMGTLEVMNGDNGGYMVKDDLQEFTARVRDLLTDNKLWKDKSQEAQAYGQNWTIGAQVEKLLEAYQSLL